MAVKRFTFAQFEPALWSLPETDSDGPVLEIGVPAPDGASRDEVRSRVFAIPAKLHDSFVAYNVVHDEWDRVTTYESEADDKTTERVLVFPTHFTVFEFAAKPGRLYATASFSTLKEILRRFREASSQASIGLSRRVVRVNDLQRYLQDASSAIQVVGYTFNDVKSYTPVRRLQAQGDRMDANPEVQDWRSRAGHVQAIDIEMQRGNEILTVRVKDDGSVTFLRYPGDTTALAVLDWLDSHVANCSDTELIQVRQGRRG